jgi:hypothetical protein
MTNFDRVSAWLQVYGKQPSKETFSLQTGCMIEEFVEFLRTIQFDDCSKQQKDMEAAAALLDAVGNSLKKEGALLSILDPAECLDALCDVDVTLNGVSYFAGFDKNGADNEVMTSNESKFENGRPVILSGGKIGKGCDFKPPQLEKFILHAVK